MKEIEVEPVAPTMASTRAKEETEMATRYDATKMLHVITIKLLPLNGVSLG